MPTLALIIPAADVVNEELDIDGVDHLVYRAG